VTWKTFWLDTKIPLSLSNVQEDIAGCIYILSHYTLGQSGIETEFGKNRIQHHDDFDDWYSMKTKISSPIGMVKPAMWADRIIACRSGL
jgi:hypothetical protein